MFTLRVFLEDIEGDWFGWMEAYPGGYSQGATPPEAIHRAPQAFQHYIQWLRAHGENVLPRLLTLLPSEIHVESIEISHSQRVASGGAAHGFFKPDERLVDEDDVETYLRLRRHAREELIAAVHSLSPDLWNSAPFGGKSLTVILRHMATMDQYFLERLRLPVSSQRHTDPLAQAEAALREFEVGVRSFPAHRRGDIFTLDSEQWSMRKILRRALWHERYHAQQIMTRADPSGFLHSAVVNTVLWDEGAYTRA